MRFNRIKAKSSVSSPSQTKSKIKNDVIFISVILIAVLLATLALFIFKTEGSSVTVTVDGKLFGEYSLNENRSVEIKSGSGYNILVIDNGAAYVKEASCPDGICSSHRPIRYNGESIICLPNKVVVEVISDSQDQPDIIA